jgi:hypothetical protein
MRTKIDVQLRQLKCLVKNEGSTDEPYLWIFAAKADGTNVAINNQNNGLAANISVQSKPGSQENLGTTDMPAAIMPAMGAVSDVLHPIKAGILGQTIHFPGFLFLVATVMEEDRSDNDDAENAREDLANMIKGRIENFFNQQGFIQKIISKAEAESNVPVGSLSQPHFTKAYLELLQQLRQDIKDVAPFFVDSALGRGTPKMFGGNWDPDDYIGSAVMVFEQSTLTTQAIDEVIDDAEFEGRYALTGDVQAKVLSLLQFIRKGTIIHTETAESGRYTFAENEKSLCIQPSQQIEWQRVNQVEEETFIYPEITAPIELEWKVGGQVLDFGGTQTFIEFQSDCYFEQFDPSSPKRPVSSMANKTVRINFFEINQNGLQGIRLQNRPEDGNYYVNVEVFARVGAIRQILIRDDFSFEGQRVVSAFYESYRECIEKFENVDDKFSESKRIGPKDLWGSSSSGRIRWFEHQLKIAERFQSAGKLSQEEVEALKVNLKNKLHL